MLSAHQIHQRALSHSSRNAPLRPHPLSPFSAASSFRPLLPLSTRRGPPSTPTTLYPLAAMSSDAPAAGGGAADLSAPPAVPTLDRSQFQTTMRLVALRLPKDKCHLFKSSFKGYAFEKPKLKGVVWDEGREDTRLFCLDDEKIKTAADVATVLPEPMRKVRAGTLYIK
jgi:hypothetical protein